MMRTVLIHVSAAALLCSPAAAATTVLVKAGEHQGYSRLVFDRAPTGLKLQQDGKRISITNIDPAYLMDLSAINDQHKAHRVTNASRRRGAKGDTLDLIVNCDCTARPLRLGDGKYVLDIVDRAPSNENADKPASRDKYDSVAAANEAVKRAKSVETDRLSVEQAHDRMVALLKQAADDGLITIKSEKQAAAAAPTTLTPTPQPQMDTPEAADSKPVDEPDAKPAAVAPTRAAPRCLPDAALLIDASGTDDDPLSHIASLQSALAESSGDALQENVYGLAETYLSVGFGEEALALLKDYDAEHSFRADMARIIAERPLSDDSQLMQVNRCQGAHALWQAAASDAQAAAALYQRANGSLKRFPSRLRKLLATRLAIKMIDAGAWNLARELFELAAPNAANEETVLQPELAYVKARLEEQEGDADSSRRQLLEIASDNSDVADDALLALADSYVKDGRNPHEGFTEDIGALAKTVGSSKAAFTEAGAWANLGNIDAAMMLLESESKKSSALKSKARAAALPILKRAFSQPGPLLKIAALDAALEHAAWLDIKSADPALHDQLANLALDAGLPNLALSLRMEKQGNDTKDDDLLRAAAALAAGDSEKAIRYSAPFAAEPGFAEIFVNANIKKADHHAALAAAVAIQDRTLKAKLTARAGWLARSWSSAVDGFNSIDPLTMTEPMAVQYLLAAHMNNTVAAPAAAMAVLSESRPTLSAGLSHFFLPIEGRTALERSKRVARAVAEEISAYEEILSDG